MCVRSQQVTLWDLLDAPTQSSAGSPASLGALLENNAEQTTPATCGPSTTVLSATCVHGGSSARTCPVCCLKVPTQSSPIWKRRATPAGRLYWVLTTSARRTDASECSLLRAWPTPTTIIGTTAANLSEEAATRELERSVSQNGAPSYLTVAVLGRSNLWPTPTSHPEDQTLDAWKRRAQMKAQNGINLHLKLGVAVQMWPTPTMQDGKNAAGPSQWNRNSWPLNVAAVAGQAGPQSPEDRNMLGKSRARLNPRWVAQLMGFPADWLDGVQVPSAASATR